MNELQDVDRGEYPEWLKYVFTPWTIKEMTKHTEESMHEYLSGVDIPDFDKILSFCLEHHSKEEVFFAFAFILAQDPFQRERIFRWVDIYPPLVYKLLKKFPPDEHGALPPPLHGLAHPIIRNIIRCANEIRIAALVALEKISHEIFELPFEQYTDLLMLTAHFARSPELAQEVFLVLNDFRLSQSISNAFAYGNKLALGIAVDRAEEAADECPCDKNGRPKRQRIAPAHVKLK